MRTRAASKAQPSPLMHSLSDLPQPPKTAHAHDTGVGPPGQAARVAGGGLQRSRAPDDERCRNCSAPLTAASPPCTLLRVHRPSLTRPPNACLHCSKRCPVASNRDGRSANLPLAKVEVSVRALVDVLNLDERGVLVLVDLAALVAEDPTLAVQAARLTLGLHLR